MTHSSPLFPWEFAVSIRLDFVSVYSQSTLKWWWLLGFRSSVGRTKRSVSDKLTIVACRTRFASSDLHSSTRVLIRTWSLVIMLWCSCYMLEKCTRHFSEPSFYQVKPQAMLGGMNRDKSMGFGREIRHGFPWEICRMMVKNNANPVSFWIIGIHFLEQRNDPLASMSIVYLPDQMAGIQIQRSPYRNSPQSPVFIISQNARVFWGCGRISGAMWRIVCPPTFFSMEPITTGGLSPSFNCSCVSLTSDRQYLMHLSFTFRRASFQIISDLMRANWMLR